jgi:hypothetical protein
LGESQNGEQLKSEDMVIVHADVGDKSQTTEMMKQRKKERLSR